MTVCGYMADLYGLLPGWGRMPPFLLYTGFGWRAMRLGLIQMDVVSGDKERNITHAFELMGESIPSGGYDCSSRIMDDWVRFS